MPITSETVTTTRKSYYHTVWQQTINGLSQTHYDLQGQRTIGTEQKVWTKDTDWRVKVKKHLSASNPYTLRKWEYCFPGYYRSTLASKAWNINLQKYDVITDKVFEHDITKTNYVGIGTTDETLRDQALARLKRKLQGAVGNVEMMIPTVELREMRGMITQAAEFSGRTLLAMSELIRKKSGRALAKQMQNSWLAYSFGIKPMISDINGALKAVDNYFERPMGLHRFRGSAQKRWVNSNKVLTEAYHGWALAGTATVVNTLRYTYSTGIDFKLLYGNNYSVGEHLGFSDFWSQLPALGWELTPFSWIADYFSTVGAYLGDTFVLPPGSTKYLTLSRVYTGDLLEKTAAVRSLTPGQYVQHVVFEEHNTPAIARLVTMDRTVIANLPHRSLRLKTVDEIGNHAVNKLLNLCSLVGFDAKRKLR